MIFLAMKLRRERWLGKQPRSRISAKWLYAHDVGGGIFLVIVGISQTNNNIITILQTKLLPSVIIHFLEGFLLTKVASTSFSFKIQFRFLGRVLHVNHCRRLVNLEFVATRHPL
jgi:hypothetical protein